MKLNPRTLSPLFSLFTGLLCLFSGLLAPTTAFPQVSINNDGSAPDVSAMLEVKSANRGLLFPRINFANRPVAPATGLTIYQLDSGPGIYYYDGNAWQKMSLAAYDFWNPSGSDIYYGTGRVGIGVTSPDSYGLMVQNYIVGKSAVIGTNKSGTTTFSAGYLGILNPGPLGVPTGTDPYNVGVLGIKPNTGNNGAAVYGWNNDDNTGNYAGLFWADGANTTNGTNYAVYAVAKKATYNYAGYFKGRVDIEGNSGNASGTDSTSTLLTVNVNHSRSTNSIAIYATSEPQPGYGYGMYGVGGNRGVYGVGAGGDYSNYVYGVFGLASGTAGTRIGVYGSAFGGTANWASYFVGSNYMSGDLRIGTTAAATGYSLSINGKIACTEVLVQAMANWPDYVFTKNHKLMSLETLEENILENGHLPGLPSAAEVETNGIQLGEMQRRMVEKMEELTLYAIEQGKLLKELRQEVERVKAENARLTSLIEK